MDMSGDSFNQVPQCLPFGQPVSDILCVPCDSEEDSFLESHGSKKAEGTKLVIHCPQEILSRERVQIVFAPRTARFEGWEKGLEFFDNRRNIHELALSVLMDGFGNLQSAVCIGKIFREFMLMLSTFTSEC